MRANLTLRAFAAIALLLCSSAALAQSGLLYSNGGLVISSTIPSPSTAGWCLVSAGPSSPPIYEPCPTGTGGGVTSVGASVPNWLSVSGSPVTTSGTLAITSATEPANYVLAAPDGTSGPLAPRALVGADIPTLNQSTTGNAATATALAATPSVCGSGQAAQGVVANGNATGCFTPSGGSSPGSQSTVLTSPYTNATTGYTSILALPSVAASATVRGSCDLDWSSNTASTISTFAIELSQTPTNLLVDALPTDSSFIGVTVTTITSTTQTQVASYTASATANTNFHLHLNFALQNGSSANTLTVYAKANADTMTVITGSACGWLP
ncbi:MAG: hypothetical protein WAU56_07515 [Steroidobacteraceae bacterium]